jgi:hypothetical protein
MARKSKFSKKRESLVAIPATAIAAVATTTTAATESAAATTAAAAAESAATTATAATTKSTTTATTATTTAPLFAGTGFIDGQCAATMFLAVESGDSGLRLVIGSHFDEPKTLATAGVPIVDDLGRHNLAMLAKQLLELRAIH